MEWDLTVNEFTLTGELVPSDRICVAGEDLDAGLARAGTLCGTTEEADEPPEKPIAARVYEQEETAHVLIELVVMGVVTWISCRDRMSYLRFTRDWLGELVDLKRTYAESGLREELEDLRQEAGYVLAEVADEAASLRAPAGRRIRRRRA